MALSEDGRILVAADRNNCLSVIRLNGNGKEMGNVVHVLRGHDGRVTNIAISVKKNLIASASEDGSGMK